MAMSEQLSKLAQRTKVLEDRAAAAKKEARADRLGMHVDLRHGSLLPLWWGA